MNVIGLMSGTSMDGVTAALIELADPNQSFDFQLLDYETFDYPVELKRRILELVNGGDIEELTRLNYEIGQVFADAALELIHRSEVPVELIGSHGQTVCHLPSGGKDEMTYTLQIGEADVIAEETGVTTVSDFRPRDIAAGGEGAPLIPYVDYELFRSDSEDRVALNLGGIANVTYLPAGGNIDEVVAFDTGPANMVIDNLVRRFTDGEEEFDRDGKWAAQGSTDKVLLNWLMNQQFVKKEPPKSTGRKDFGENFANVVEEKGRSLELSKSDVLATVTSFTAEAISYNCKRYLDRIDTVITSGGGTNNEILMDELSRRMDARITTTEEFGLSSEAKEAAGFALLARETILSRPSNVPGATGAGRSVILGKISQVAEAGD